MTNEQPDLSYTIATYALETLILLNDHKADCPRCQAGRDCTEEKELQQEFDGSYNAYRQARLEEQTPA